MNLSHNRLRILRAHFQRDPRVGIQMLTKLIAREYVRRILERTIARLLVISILTARVSHI